MRTWDDVAAMADAIVSDEDVRGALRGFMDLRRSEASLRSDLAISCFPDKLDKARHHAIRVVLKEAKLPIQAEDLLENDTVKEAMAPAYDLGTRILRMEKHTPEQAKSELADVYLLAIRGIIWEAVQLEFARSVQPGQAAPVEDGNPGPSSGAVVASKHVSFGGVEERLLKDTTDREDRANDRNELRAAQEALEKAERKKKKSKARAEVAPVDPVVPAPADSVVADPAPPAEKPEVSGQTSQTTLSFPPSATVTFQVCVNVDLTSDD